VTDVQAEIHTAEIAVRIMKILVPLDGSPVAEAALPKAVELAKQNDAARLVLVRAVDPATVPSGFTAVQVAAINGAAEYLHNLAAQLRSQGVNLVSRSVWYATAGPAIVEAARAVRPDFIVMVSSEADRLVPGPVAEFVLHRTRMPIVLVAPGNAPAKPPRSLRSTARELRRADPPS
jgi:nucleotide-binding universal stress UspA family protein